MMVRKKKQEQCGNQSGGGTEKVIASISRH